jgi:hypothetical protein
VTAISFPSFDPLAFAIMPHMFRLTFSEGEPLDGNFCVYSFSAEAAPCFRDVLACASF